MDRRSTDSGRHDAALAAFAAVVGAGLVLWCLWNIGALLYGLRW